MYIMPTCGPLWEVSREQLRTIDKRRLKDKICHLTPEQLALVNEALKISLDLPT